MISINSFKTEVPIILFCKYDVLEYFGKIRRKTPVPEPLFKWSTFIKKETWGRWFFVNFAKFLRTSFYVRQLCWLLLNVSRKKCYKRKTTFRYCTLRKRDCWMIKIDSNPHSVECKFNLMKLFFPWMYYFTKTRIRNQCFQIIDCFGTWTKEKTYVIFWSSAHLLLL